MPRSPADTRRQPGAATAEDGGPRAAEPGPAALGPTLALSVILAFAGFLAAMGGLLLVVHPVPIPGLPLRQNQDAETLLYLGAFVVILPLALLAGTRLADSIAAGPNGPALGALSGLLGSALALALIAIKASGLLSWGDTVGVAFLAALAWWAAAGAALARAARPRPWSALLRLSDSAGAVWAGCAVVAFGVLLCLTDLGSVSLPGFLLGAAAVIGVLAAYEKVGRPRLARRWRIAIDLAVLALIVLAVPDLVVARPEQAPGSLLISLETSIIQFHQNFLLGPANEVLSGRAMLVDTASQYGVGLIYLLAGWFNLVPIGYGTLGLLSGIASALAFAAGYCVLRISGVSRLLASATIALGVVVLIFNATYPVDSIPQDSTLRFGLPIISLLALVAGQRWPTRHRLAWGVALAVAGISAIYSFEAFAYTLFTIAAIACTEAWTLAPGGRVRWLGRRALAVLAACVGAHLLFALITLVFAGVLPDWGQYIAYLRAFLFESLGDLNYDFARWSPGIAVGAEYLASAAGVVLIALRAPDLARAERTTLVALAGTTAYGVAIFSYFDNRSTDFSLLGVALPALMIAALWLGLVLRPGLAGRRQRLGGLAFAGAVAVLLLSVGWSSIGERYPNSALAHVVPGGDSLRGALQRLRHMPALNQTSVEGQRLLETYMPGERRSLILMTPDPETEILVRSGRGNLLPIAAPWQDSFVAEERLPGLKEAVDDLRPGQRMLLDEPALKSFALLRADPSVDPLIKQSTRGNFAPVPAEIAPLQAWALRRIGERFDLRTIARGEDGLEVVELVPRRGSSG